MISSSCPRPQVPLLRLGLLGALGGCLVGAALPLFTDPIFEDDTFMKTMLSAILLVVSAANVYIVRVVVLPAQVVAAEKSAAPDDGQAFALSARSSGVLAMTFVLANSAYAIVLALFTGWPWIVAPFGLFAFIQFAAFSSYLEREYARIWRDKIQLGSSA